MSDATTPAGGATPATTPETAPEPTNTPSVDELQSSVNASRRREAEAQKALKEANERLAALEAKEKERQEAEMSELEKAQAEAAELKKQIEGLNGYKTQWEQHEAAQKEQVAKAMEGLSDDQKDIVNAISDPAKQLAAINQFSAKPPAATAGKGGRNSSGEKFFSEEDVRKMSQSEVLANLHAINESRKQW